MEALKDYFYSFVTQWWLVMSVPPSLASIISMGSERWGKRFFQLFSIRKPFGLTLFILGIFLSGFFAWKEENTAKENLAKHITDLSTADSKEIAGLVRERDNIQNALNYQLMLASQPQPQTEAAPDAMINVGGQNSTQNIVNSDLCENMGPVSSLITTSGSGGTLNIYGSHLSGKCPSK